MCMCTCWQVICLGCLHYAKPKRKQNGQTPSELLPLLRSKRCGKPHTSKLVVARASTGVVHFFDLLLLQLLNTFSSCAVTSFGNVRSGVIGYVLWFFRVDAIARQTIFRSARRSKEKLIMQKSATSSPSGKRFKATLSPGEPISCDVLIIGAGYTGCSAAQPLLQARHQGHPRRR